MGQVVGHDFLMFGRYLQTGSRAVKTAKHD
jgi:hypothetical protein